MYNTIIFDFNGTLFFDTEYHNQAWNEIFTLLTNSTLSKKDLETKIHGVPNVVAIENLFPLKYDEKTKVELSLKKEELYRNIVKEINPILVQGSLPLFGYLKSNSISFTIASASIKENIDFFYDIFNLKTYFNKDDIIYDDGTYINKVPMFLDAIKKINGDIKKTIIFEDSISGVNNAIEAGCEKIILIYDKQIPQQLLDNNKIIFHSNNFDDVIVFLKTIV